MKLEEAVMSGKPFKRKGDPERFLMHLQKDDEIIMFNGRAAVFTKSDITADDYELKEG